ncbi:MAG: DNA polymerase III subunit gamma/tau [Ruminococcaceae bacterium]|nr:DNA polymerase III subunit gamma/tau [Oscillospiraceae bacterium]
MYQALYRKWRPQTFSDVSGQETVTTALKNELKTGRLSHAYLFTGCRGTGKTTCAKILAKAVNCLHPVDGDPCNECEICRGINAGSVLDVTEIDAASNNGVDSIRELRDEVAYTPVSGRYRVYIIDEVHMLSAGAFNALLKTLEEPPAHVIFVLATTEVHKLPATILSRCQRFDFGRIRPEEIAARIRYVAAEEGLTVTDEAALLLARMADGALRDALSLLDQCASVAKEIDRETVASVTGMAGQETLAALTDCVARQDAPAALVAVDELYRSAKDMERLCAEWVGYLRNLMILHSMPDPGALVIVSPEELARMRQQASGLGLATILHMMEVLQGALDRLRGGVSRRVEMEMAVIRLCDPRLDDSKAALLHRLDNLEVAVKAGVPTAPTPAQPVAPAVTAPAAQPEPIPAPAGEPEPIPTPEAPPPLPEGEVPFAPWVQVLEHLSTANPPLWAFLQETTALQNGESLILCISSPLLIEVLKEGGNKQSLVEAIQTVTGRTYSMKLRRSQKVQKAEIDPLSQLLTAGRDAGVGVNEN